MKNKNDKIEKIKNNYNIKYKIGNGKKNIILTEKK